MRRVSLAGQRGDRSLQTAARVAGFMYLLVIAIGVLNTVFVDSTLVVPGDDAATVGRIVAQGFRFRIGMAATLIMYAGVVVLSVALYAMLEPMNRSLALVALLLRSAEAMVGCATVLLSLLVAHLLEREGIAAPSEAGQVQRLVRLFLDVRTASLDIVLLLVGLGGAVFGYLLLRSSFVPAWLAGWGIFTYLSMVGLALLSITIPDHPVTIESVLYALGGSFELVIGLWLLVKGANVLRLSPHGPTEDRRPSP